MSIELTESHNEAAWEVMNLFLEQGEEKHKAHPEIFVSCLAFFAGQQLLRQRLGEKLGSYTPRTPLLVAEISNGGSQYLGFFQWLCEALGFNLEKKEQVERLDDKTCGSFLDCCKMLESRAKAVMDSYKIDATDRVYVCLLAAAKAAEFTEQHNEGRKIFDFAGYAFASGARTVPA